MTVPSRILTAACALGVGLAVVAHAATENVVLADATYLGVMIGASAFAWAGVGRWPPAQRPFPRLIAAGISLTALGDLLWTVLDRAGMGTDASVADVAWFASYVFLCVAVWMVLSNGRAAGRAYVDFVVDVVTVAVVSVLFFWAFSVNAIIEDASLSPLVRTVWSAYPILDAVLLALVLRVLVSRRARATIDVWFAVGVSLWLAADLLYLHASDYESAVTVMDAAWMVAPVLLARAAWRPQPDQAPVTEGASASEGWAAQLLLAVFPLTVPPGLELLADLRGHHDHPLQLFVGMTVVMVLAFIRVGRLIRSEQLAQHELELARDVALAASDAKSMFLANMSHELRTPLTTVLVAGGLLNETPMSDTQKMLLEKLHRSGEQLQSLVEGLLDFSRIEAGRVVLDRAELDLQALVTDVVDAHLQRAERKGVGFDWSVDPSVPEVVVGDRNRVFQVLNNLVENALKFTESGQVRLTAGPLDYPRDFQDRGVQFTVTDTGIGVRAEDLDSIFESFTQVDGSASRNYQGTGLGLAISKQLTELMGGTIAVRSELGVGSTFTVRLPLVAPASNGRDPAPVRTPLNA